MFWLMAKNDTMNRVFILNDKTSACQLNHNFHTSKFTYLPDPVPEIEELKLSNLRSIYNIPDKNKVYLHFGRLTYRKGTLEILKAINIMDNKQLKEKTFIFAGRVYKEMHNEFYQLLELAKEKVQILVFDAFCEYDFLYNLCYTCDAILMPYQQNEMSSGVLGYAAVFNKPVIGPDGGLIGNIIKKYHLGYCLPAVNKNSIAQSLTQDICCDSSSYVKDNDVNNFINTLLD